MTDEIIPEDIKQFLMQNIDSIAQWEGLLLLRAEADQEWTAERLSQRLYIHATEAAALLDRLVDRKFVVRKPKPKFHYLYAPATSEQADMVARVADYYSRYLVSMTNLIHSKSKHKVQKFADAFRIKKD